MKNLLPATIKSCLMLLACFGMSMSSYAQENTTENAPHNTPNYTVDLSIARGDASFIGLMFRKNFYLGSKKKIIISPGVRVGHAIARNSLDYTSAPAKITKNANDVDIFALADSDVFTANLALNLGYRFSDKFSLILDIDFLGISFGKEQNGDFKPGKTSSDAMLVASANNKSNPTSPNILLIGDNDRGTLSSALTLNYAISKRIGVKLGVGYLFTEYTSDSELGALNNDRWRAKSIQYALGANYNF